LWGRVERCFSLVEMGCWSLAFFLTGSKIQGMQG
jgi:hypothetical protein